MVAVNNMNAEAFFTALMEALKKNPPHVHDQGVVARSSRLGLELGKSFAFKSRPAHVQEALQDAPTNGLKVIGKRGQNLGSGSTAGPY